MKSTEAARALAALRKRKGPKPVRRWRCYDCDEKLGTNQMRWHECPEAPGTSTDMTCTNCGERMTRSQTRTHKCEAVDRRGK